MLLFPAQHMMIDNRTNITQQTTKTMNFSMQLQVQPFLRIFEKLLRNERAGIF